AGEIPGGCKAMASTTDDDHIVVGLGIRLAPGRLPVAVAGKRVSEEGESGVFCHDFQPTVPEEPIARRADRTQSMRHASPAFRHVPAGRAGEVAALSVDVANRFGHARPSPYSLPATSGRSRGQWQNF